MLSMIARSAALGRTALRQRQSHASVVMLVSFSRTTDSRQRRTRQSASVLFAARESFTLALVVPFAQAAPSASSFPTPLCLAIHSMMLNQIALYVQQEHTQIRRVLKRAHRVFPENTSVTAFQSTSTTVNSTVSSVRSESSRKLPVRQLAQRAKAAQRLQQALPVATAVLAATHASQVFRSLAAKGLTVPARGSAWRAPLATNVPVVPIELLALPATTKTTRVRRTASHAQLVLIKRSVVRPFVMPARGATSVRLGAPAR